MSVNIDRLIDKNIKDGLFRSEMAKDEIIGYECNYVREGFRGLVISGFRMSLPKKALPIFTSLNVFIFLRICI